MNQVKCYFTRLSITFIFIGSFQSRAVSQDIEKINRDNISISWADCIAAYKKLDVENKSAQLIEAGLTDVGKPLHLFVL
ncbi:MAG: hypothetical protein ACKO9S_09045, partial [Bacteroidota bacterium]